MQMKAFMKSSSLGDTSCSLKWILFRCELSLYKMMCPRSLSVYLSVTTLYAKSTFWESVEHMTVGTTFPNKQQYIDLVEAVKGFSREPRLKSWVRWSVGRSVTLS